MSSLFVKEFDAIRIQPNALNVVIGQNFISLRPELISDLMAG